MKNNKKALLAAITAILTLNSCLCISSVSAKVMTGEHITPISDDEIAKQLGKELLAQKQAGNKNYVVYPSTHMVIDNDPSHKKANDGPNSYKVKFNNPDSHFTIPGKESKLSKNPNLTEPQEPDFPTPNPSNEALNKLADSLNLSKLADVLKDKNGAIDGRLSSGVDNLNSNLKNGFDKLGDNMNDIKKTIIDGNNQLNSRMNDWFDYDPCCNYRYHNCHDKNCDIGYPHECHDRRCPRKHGGRRCIKQTGANIDTKNLVTSVAAATLFPFASLAFMKSRKKKFSK